MSVKPVSLKVGSILWSLSVKRNQHHLWTESHGSELLVWQCSPSGSVCGPANYTVFFCKFLLQTSVSFLGIATVRVTLRKMNFMPPTWGVYQDAGSTCGSLWVQYLMILDNAIWNRKWLTPVCSTIVIYPGWKWTCFVIAANWLTSHFMILALYSDSRFICFFNFRGVTLYIFIKFGTQVSLTGIISYSRKRNRVWHKSDM